MFQVTSTRNMADDGDDDLAAAATIVLAALNDKNNMDLSNQ